MSAGEYLVGAGLFALNWGAAALVAWLLVTRRLTHLTGAAAVVAGGLLLALGVFVTNLLPAALGVLSQGTVVVASLVWGLAGWALTRDRSAVEPERWPAPREPLRASVALAWIGVAIAAIWVAGAAIGLARVPPTNIDTLGFHLPGIARWIQSGSIWQIDQLIPLVPTGHYPSTGNIIELSAVLPWESDFAFRLVGLPFLALAALATYAIGRELGSERPAAALIAAATVTVPSVLSPAVVTPLPDAIFVGCFAAGLLFLVRHFRTDLGSDLILAGIGFGVAFGTKWYAVSSVPVLIFVWAICLLAGKRGLRSVLTDTLIVGGITLGLGGVWLLRNWIESDNPFFPASLEFGPVAFDAPPDPRGEQIEATVLDFIGDWHVVRESFVPGWLDSLGVGGYALALAIPVSLLFIVFRWRRPDLSDRRWLGVALASSAAALALLYAGTPSTAPAGIGDLPEVSFNARYAVPALLVAAGCANWIAASLRGRWLIVIEALAVVAVINGIRESLDPGASSLLAAAIGLGAAVWLGRIVWSRRGETRLLAGAAATLALGAGVAGYAVMRGFEDKGYGGYASTDYVLEHAPEDTRIGIAAAWSNDTISPTRAMFGPRLRNDVFYVGEFRSGQLAPLEGEAEFVAALEREHPDLLLVGRGYYRVKDDPKQAKWAREIGFEEVARDATLVLMRAPWARERGEL